MMQRCIYWAARAYLFLSLSLFAITTITVTALLLLGRDLDPRVRLWSIAFGFSAAISVWAMIAVAKRLEQRLLPVLATATISLVAGGWLMWSGFQARNAPGDEAESFGYGLIVLAATCLGVVSAWQLKRTERG
jgi:hypothetical protein